MRDPARINKVLEAIRAYWLTYPDLRLGQIVVNVCGTAVSTRDRGSIPFETSDIFYMEEDEFLAGLNSLFQQLK